MPESNSIREQDLRCIALKMAMEYNDARVHQASGYSLPDQEVINIARNFYNFLKNG